MNRLYFQRTILLSFSTVLATNAQLYAVDHNTPNVIIILNDDLGYSDLSCYGAKDISTPNIDAIAESGVKFTDFYVASSVSSASRAALLTGCYPQHVGVNGVIFPSSNSGLAPEYVTIAEIMKKAGYNTAAIGKWHLGDKKDFLPTNQGFDYYYGIPYSNDMYPTDNIPYAKDCNFRDGYSKAKIMTAFKRSRNKSPESLKNKVPLVKNTECIEFPCNQTTITKRYADESIDFIEKCVESNQPFFLYLANSMPHVPLYVSEEFKGSSSRGLYGDVIQEIDYNVGRILSTLEKLNIRENTLIIFLSDNGPWLAMGEKAGRSLPLFEGKFTCFEGGFRVPGIFSWPNKIPKGEICNRVASSIDIFPTLAYLTGVDIKRNIDGKNISNLLVEPKSPSPHDDFFMVFSAAAMRSGIWKYHSEGIVYQVKETAREEKGPALYNLKEDIGETKNLIGKYPKIAKKMQKKLDDHIKTFSKPISIDKVK